MLIRESTSDDVARIIALYPQAFPDEDLVPVVTELLDDPEIKAKESPDNLYTLCWLPLAKLNSQPIYPGPLNAAWFQSNRQGERPFPQLPPHFCVI